MWFWRRKEVYICFSMIDFDRVRSTLANNQIKYDYKVVSSTGSSIGRGTHRGNFGSYGINPDFEKQYYIFVDGQDYEKAIYAINNK